MHMKQGGMGICGSPCLIVGVRLRHFTMALRCTRTRTSWTWASRLHTWSCAQICGQHGLAHDHVGVNDEDELLLGLCLLQPVQNSHWLVDAAAQPRHKLSFCDHKSGCKGHSLQGCFVGTATESRLRFCQCMRGSSGQCQYYLTGVWHLKPGC